MKRRKSAWAYLAIGGLVVTGLVASPAPTEAQSGGYQRGPNPTQSTVLTNGSFATTQQSNVSPGFGGGYNNVNVCYPNDTSQGTFGGFVVIPGFFSFKSQMMWACRKIASHGFVVAVMETNSIFDFPGSRANQAQGVIEHLSSDAPSAIAQRLDTSRWAVGGWSMGGGGALDAGSRNNPELQAVVGWEPWNISTYIGLTVPALIVGASNDLVASAGTMAEPFYRSIALAEKYYVELSGEGHFVGSQDHTIQSAATITWLKRWVDDDTRYDSLLCPGPGTGSGIAQIETSCPMSG